MVVAAACAEADDGIPYRFGAPRLMHGESNIRMVLEFVSADVFRDHADVHCRFVLANDGPPVDARIGFPGGSDNSYDDGSSPKPSLEHFRSAVDGKPVSTRVEFSSTGSGQAPLYHAKSVHFAMHQTRVVEDWYTGDLSGGGTNTLVSSRKNGQENLYVSQFEYVMGSGGSWKGNILQATVVVRFMEPRFRHLQGFPESQFGPPLQSTRLNRLPREGVIWAGFATPGLDGNGMTFQRTNFKPTDRDNVHLWFDALPFNDSIWSRSHQ